MLDHVWRLLLVLQSLLDLTVLRLDDSIFGKTSKALRVHALAAARLLALTCQHTSAGSIGDVIVCTPKFVGNKRLAERNKRSQVVIPGGFSAHLDLQWYSRQ
jgi:hypothetical protein